MDVPPAFLAWVQTKSRSVSNQGTVIATVFFLLGAAILFVTFWVVYAVLWFGFNWIVAHAYETRLLITAAIVLVLFVLNAVTNRRALEKLSYTTGTKHPKAVHFYIRGVGMGSTVNPFSKEYAQSFIRVFASAALTGPHIMTEAAKFFFRAMALRTLDVAGCAAVLHLLAERATRVPFAEISQTFPPDHHLQSILGQLRQFDGVLFLKSEPAGLALGEELLGEANRALGARKKNRRKETM